MDKINFVIFVITHLLLELQVDKTARVARHFASSIHTFSGVVREIFRGPTLCLEASERTHFSVFTWFSKKKSAGQTLQ